MFQVAWLLLINCFDRYNRSYSGSFPLALVLALAVFVVVFGQQSHLADRIAPSCLGDGRSYSGRACRQSHCFQDQAAATSCLQNWSRPLPLYFLETFLLENNAMGAHRRAPSRVHGLSGILRQRPCSTKGPLNRIQGPKRTALVWDLGSRMAPVSGSSSSCWLLDVVFVILRPSARNLIANSITVSAAIIRRYQSSRVELQHQNSQISLSAQSYSRFTRSLLVSKVINS